MTEVGYRIEGFFLIYFLFFNELAEREGFEHSVFLRMSMGYKVVVSSSCLRKAQKITTAWLTNDYMIFST